MISYNRQRENKNNYYEYIRGNKLWQNMIGLLRGSRLRNHLNMKVEFHQMNLWIFLQKNGKKITQTIFCLENLVIGMMNQEMKTDILKFQQFQISQLLIISFSNKKIQKQYDESIEELRDEVEDDDFDDVLYEYEPILLLIAIDLKEEIIYASVDLGNGVVEDVAKEKLADNEKDFRNQIQRMINAF